MCNNNNENRSNECRCIAEILQTINVLQNNAECNDVCLDTCDRGFLGCNMQIRKCNTRPVMLYTCCGNGTPWAMPTEKVPSCSASVNNSCIFRIEKLDGCCATFRVLEFNTDTDVNAEPYVATNSFFTMNLNCVCSLRCLDDTFVCL